MNGTDILQIIAPIVAAFLGGGGIVAYYNYKGSKPKTKAEAQKLEADVVVTFAEGWKQYSEKLETNIATLEKKQLDNEKSLADLKRQMEEQDAKNRSIIQQKDSEIAELQSKNRQLEVRVGDLESELTKYRQSESKIDTVRENLHVDVDKNLDKIKK